MLTGQKSTTTAYFTTTTGVLLCSNVSSVKTYLTTYFHGPICTTLYWYNRVLDCML